MDDFLSKPVRKNLLMSTIYRCLRDFTAAGDSSVVPQVTTRDLIPLHICNTDIFSRSDYQVLEGELGREAMEEAFGCFISEMKHRLSQLHSLDLDRAREDIRREAHSIKGAAATFGLRRCSALGAWLEQNVRDIDGVEFERVVGEIRSAYLDSQASKEWPLAA